MLYFPDICFWVFGYVRHVCQNFGHTIKPEMPPHGTTEHWRNSRTPQNSGGTTENPTTPAEHPEIPTEHQHNISGSPQKNGTIQNEEQF